MIKHLHIKTIFLLLAVLCIVCSCEESELLEEKEAGTDTKVITINGLTDPEFMTLAAPFTSNAVAGRVLQDSDFQKVKKLTGNGYVTYTVPISSLNNAPSASHSLVMSLRDDTVRYNLLEIIPDKSWNGKFEAFTGSINTYLIEFSKQKKNIAGKELNKAHVDDCYVFVIDEVIVHADLSATAVGHWEHQDGCIGGDGGGGYSDGGYYWVPDWGSGESGNWSDGGSTGSGGSGTSGDYDDSEPKYEEVPISVEEALIELWETGIDDTQLDPCVKDILDDLRNINTGMGQVIQNFFKEGPKFSWSIKSSNLGINKEIGLTTVNGINNTIVTEINSDRTSLASDLSLARTLIHEAVHAQLVYYQINDPNAALLSYSEILFKYGSDLTPNEQDHINMTMDLIGFVTSSLKEYGNSKGYNVSDGYYAALAWGGLTDTPAFKSFTSTQEQAILDVINIELMGKDSFGQEVSQKGGDSGC